jgi:hypothetical protein
VSVLTRKNRNCQFQVLAEGAIRTKTNFLRQHHSLGTTPAVAAGLEEKPWSLEQVVENDGGLLPPERGCEIITALAVETLLGSLLAWMSIQASVTLSVVLTASLLLLAFRERALFWLVTVVAIGMLWRGESWKALCLLQEEQMSRLPPQCRQLLTKTRYSTPDLLIARDGAHHVPPQVLRPFLAEEFEETHWSLKGIQTPQDRSEHRKGNHKAPVTLQPLDLEACLALMNAEPDFERREPHPGSQTNFRRSELELPARSDRTPTDFI